MKEANEIIPTVKKEDDGATKGKENYTSVEKKMELLVWQTGVFLLQILLST